MRFGSLFAGIGGFDLGFERAGMECAWQVEIDEYCLKVLEKHWPDVPRYRDVKELHGVLAHASSDGQHSTKVKGSLGKTNDYRKEGKNKGGSIEGRSNSRSGMEGQCPSCLPAVDLICGGFPCQPYSVAGKRRGKDDDRNLWPEFLRIVREVRPTWVVGENVPGIVPMYLDQVLSDLEGEAYSCWTFNIPACALDAPHRRERIWIVAYRENEGIAGRQRFTLDDAGESKARGDNGTGSGTDVEREAVAYAQNPDDQNNRDRSGEIQFRGNGRSEQSQWTVEPNVGRVAHGVPKRVDRLRALGNAVVPQVTEFIGRRIMESL